MLRSRTSGSARCRTGRRSSPAAGEAASSRCATIHAQAPANTQCWSWRQDITFRRITGDGTALTPPPVGAGQAWPQLWLRMVYPCADPNVSKPLRSCWHLGCSWTVPWAVPRVPARVPAASLRQQVTRNASATPTFRNILCTRVMLSRLVAPSVLLTCEAPRHVFQTRISRCGTEACR